MLTLHARGRTLLAGKVIFNYGQSSIDCVVRRVTDEGATIELESGFGVPARFQLAIVGEIGSVPCNVTWQSDRQIGVVFETEEMLSIPVPSEIALPVEPGADRTARNQMLALREALDHAPLGIVLLDRKLKARFINRAFRVMWALSDEVADQRPSINALMMQGRDTGAYAVPPKELEAYIAKRVALISSTQSSHFDLRRPKGDVLRMHCTQLPGGGRMLSYTEVTDIVRQADELKVLRDALENVQDGVLLLDAELNATFMNRKVRDFWEISEEEVSHHPSYASLITRARRAVQPNAKPKELAGFAAKRVAEIKSGDNIRELQTPDGRRLRAHCTNMVDGGRMVTYYDVTDLTRNAEQLERLATTDPLTGLFNRRHFLDVLDAEWNRFQRYYRSVSMLMVDIDHFKSVNDLYGHGVGDEAIKAMAHSCLHGKRKSDVVGRVGGEEFAILLPETTMPRAIVVAERIRKHIAGKVLEADGANYKISASIGIAEATASMAGPMALMRAADDALYQAKADGRNRCVVWSSPPAAFLAAE